MAYLLFQTAKLREESRFNSIQTIGHEVRKAHVAELLCLNLFQFNLSCSFCLYYHTSFRKESDFLYVELEPPVNGVKGFRVLSFFGLNLVLRICKLSMSLEI